MRYTYPLQERPYDFQSFIALILGRYVTQCHTVPGLGLSWEVELRVKSCSAGVFVVGQDSPVAAPLASIAARSWEITRIPRRQCPRLEGIAAGLGLGCRLGRRQAEVGA